MCILLLDMYVFYECWLDLCWEYCVLYFFFIFLSNFLSLCERRILTFNYTCGIFFLSFQFYQLFSFHRFCSQVVSYLGFLCLTVAAAAAKSLQSCLTLCNPIDCSPPGSPIPGILQARTLEWVAISFSSAWKWKVKVKLLSRVWLFVTPWTAAYQAPPSMGFSGEEYRSRVPLPSLLYLTSRWILLLTSLIYNFPSLELIIFFTLIFMFFWYWNAHSFFSLVFSYYI